MGRDRQEAPPCHPAAAAPDRRFPGHRQAKANLAATDRRMTNLRTNQMHILTTSLARRYGTVVIEDLNIAAMSRSMGRRAFRRSVYQAGLGKVRPTLAYKCGLEGGRLVAADRWFASSKTHRGCGGYLADLRLGARLWVCPRCGSWWTVTPTRP
jgi:putative transposase